MSEPIVERPGMADYGVPTDPDGALPWAWARERLIGTRNYWVVTVDGAHRPHALPVWGVWRADDTFAFSCAPTSRKLRNLRRNPAVSVMADSTVEVVSIRGWAEIVAVTEGERDRALAAEIAGEFVAKYLAETGTPDDPDGFAQFILSNAIVRVRPELAFAIIEREEEFSSKATRWRWPASAS